MIPDSLLSPPQSHCFVLLKVLVSSSSKFSFLLPPSPVPVLFRVPFSSLLKATFPSSSFLSVLFLPLKVLSPPPRFTFPSSPSSSLLSKFSPLLLQPKKTAERHEVVPPLSWWFVPKWNMILSLLVRPQSAVARLAHLKAVVPVRQLLPGLGANVMVHADVKHAMIARPTADE